MNCLSAGSEDDAGSEIGASISVERAVNCRVDVFERTCLSGGLIDETDAAVVGRDVGRAFVATVCYIVS